MSLGVGWMSISRLLTTREELYAEMTNRHPAAKHDVNGGSLPGLTATLARSGERRTCPSCASCPERGSSWHPSFYLLKRTSGRRIPLKTQPSKSSRGLSEPVGSPP